MSLVLKFEVGGPPSQEWSGSSTELVEMAQLADSVGLDRFGVSDHRFAFDCVTLMSACLVSTKRIKVESLVMDPFKRHPLITGCTMATMADLSGGRVILGMGGGVERPSFWPEDRSKPLTAIREAVTIIRRLWGGETVDFDGEVLSCKGAKLIFPLRYKIPILIASRAPKSLTLGGELGDIILLGSRFNGPKHYMENLEWVGKGLEKSGRSFDDVEIDVSVQTCVCDDSHKALVSSRPFAAIGMLWAAGKDTYAKANYKRWESPDELAVPERILKEVEKWDFWTKGKLSLPDEIGELFTKDILDQFVISGSPDEVASRYSELMRYPHLGGIRIRAIPVAGMPVPDGYKETVRGLGKVLKILRSEGAAVSPRAA